VKDNPFLGQYTRKTQEGRERRIAQCWIFSSVLVYCLGIVLAIYIKEFFMGFLPHEGFPGYLLCIL
jgi:hypothetical protein